MSYYTQAWELIFQNPLLLIFISPQYHFKLTEDSVSLIFNFQ